VAELRQIRVGDKLAGRHGNKGVISKILPVCDMPYTKDGKPVDVILSPLSILSRMNLGQLYEAILALIGEKTGTHINAPIFERIDQEFIAKQLTNLGLPVDSRVTLYNPKTGQPYDRKALVGTGYILKLIHMVQDKFHARSIGPYSLVTQQPLGGKSQMGGQRFGEMEVWALEAYGASPVLKEMLTIKSDDVDGRSKTYNAIVKGEALPAFGVPESFNVLIKELQGLNLDIELD